VTASPLNSSGAPKLPPAIILAGGLGTRLRPVYSAGPKSMAPVADRPFLDYVLTWLRDQGVEDVVLCVGYKRSSIRKFVRKGRKWGLRVRYSVETQLLGTGGAVKKAQPLISGDTVLVINGDTLLRVNLRDLVEFHKRRRAAATLTTVKMKDHQRYGSVSLDRSNRIIRFREKNVMLARTPTALINGGVYVFATAIFNRLQSRRPISLEKDVFPQLAADRRTYGFITSAPFIDIGVPDDFRRAQVEFRERHSFGDSH